MYILRLWAEYSKTDFPVERAADRPGDFRFADLDCDGEGQVCLFCCGRDGAWLSGASFGRYSRGEVGYPMGGRVTDGEDIPAGSLQKDGQGGMRMRVIRNGVGK